MDKHANVGDSGSAPDTGADSAAGDSGDSSTLDSDAVDTADTGDTSDTGDTAYVAAPCEVPLPFALDLYLRSSEDRGVTWSDPTWLMSAVSVPDVIADPTLDGGKPWMLWMAFEDRVDQCDRLVYARIDATTGAVGWVRPTTIIGTPPLTLLDAGYPHPVSDPDMLLLGGRPVLTHTFWPADEPYPCIGISTGSTVGSIADGTFTHQPQLRWCDESGVEGYTDPVAAWAPDDPSDPDSPGLIHVFTPSASAMTTGAVSNREWIVAVPNPDDPSTWYEAERRVSSFSTFNLLGSIQYLGIPDCTWQVWGTVDASVRTACTDDLEEWRPFGTNRPQTSDPVISGSGQNWQMRTTEQPP